MIDITTIINKLSISYHKNSRVAFIEFSGGIDAKDVKEVQTNGISTQNNKDLEPDIQKANCWEAIGIGAAGYYR